MATPKDRWHQLADAIVESNLPASDKAVFRLLLDSADYVSAELPAKYTPTERTVGRKTSHSRRQVQYSVSHLRRHGWLEAARDDRGDSPDRRKLRYGLAFGTWCDCTGRRHVADQSLHQPFPLHHPLQRERRNRPGQSPNARPVRKK